ESIAIAVAEPATRGSIGISYRVGARHPLEQGADGLAILAQRPERPGDSEAVRRTREQGYAISDGEVQPGAVGIAVGTGEDGATDVEASIGIIRLGRPGDLDIDRLLPLVREARAAVARLY
ncbi:MAG TPA: transcriptional regulator, partial [Candidatus Janibacter merdipullorum]|nr:transcriptional regulator [Candidatus Janibacter merdipullorum]